jgi:hypothetical protein
MRTTFAATVAVVALVAGLSAQEKKPTTAPNVTGTWNLGLQGGHVIPVALTLEQDGKNVKGVIMLPTQRVGERVEVPLTGELVDAALTLSGTVESAAESTTIEIAGTLNDDGSMAGTITSPHGKMPWTAERLKERK